MRVVQIYSVRWILLVMASSETFFPLTSFVRGRVAAEVKREDGRRHQILSYHVVEDGRNAVDRDCIVSENGKRR